VHNIEPVQMLEPRRNIAQGAFGIEGVRNLAELVRPLDNICKRGRAPCKNDVLKVFIRILVVKITNDIGVVICIFEKVDFAFGEGNMLLDETFDSHWTALEGALVHNSALGTITMGRL